MIFVVIILAALCLAYANGANDNLKGVATLLLSPPLAILATVACYIMFRGARRRLGVVEQTCFCVGKQVIETVPVLNNGAAFQRVEQLSVSLGDSVTCQNRYQGKLLGIEAAAVLDRLHYLSSGMVCYARGLNDTPKIAAVLLLAKLSGFGSTALVGLAIAAGGVFSARKVAETMSQKITSMNHGQGFAANLVTGLIVIGASRLGLPVSTTHVSCGSLFGIGAVTGQGHRSMIGKILGAWVITLPVAAVWGAIGYWFLKQV